MDRAPDVGHANRHLRARARTCTSKQHGRQRGCCLQTQRAARTARSMRGVSRQRPMTVRILGTLQLLAPMMYGSFLPGFGTRVRESVLGRPTCHSGAPLDQRAEEAMRDKRLDLVRLGGQVVQPGLVHAWQLLLHLRARVPADPRGQRTRTRSASANGNLGQVSPACHNLACVAQRSLRQPLTPHRIERAGLRTDGRQSVVDGALASTAARVGRRDRTQADAQRRWPESGRGKSVRPARQRIPPATRRRRFSGSDTQCSAHSPMPKNAFCSTLTLTSCAPGLL